MKILVYTPVIGRGGMHLVVRTLLRGFAEHAPANWQFDILGQQFDENGTPIEYPARFKFTQLEPVDHLPLHPQLFPFLWTHQSAFYAHLSRLAPDYDLIFCLSPWWTMQVKEWCLPVPFITYIPDMAFDFINVGNLLEMHFQDVSRRIQENADMTIFSADFHCRHAVERYAFDPAKTAVIQSSADYVVSADFQPTVEEAARVRAKYNLPERYMLAFHCMYHKDPITILRAHNKLRTRFADAPALVLAGIDTDKLLKNPPADNHISDVKRLMSMVDNVSAIGRVPDGDIAGLFAGATLSISASLSEGDLSGGTLSAFMARCPHLYSWLPVYTERIGYVTSGYSFKPGDWGGLAECMYEALSNPQEARRRAETAYRWAQRRTVKDVVGEYFQLFQNVLIEEANREA